MSGNTTEEFLANFDLLEHIKKLGFKMSGGSNPRGPCPLHGGDNDSGFSLWRKNGVWLWKCHTGDCGSGNAAHFEMRRLGVGFREAMTALNGGAVLSPPITKLRIQKLRESRERQARAAAEEAAKKAEKRERWPRFLKPWPDILDAIATARKLPMTAPGLLGASGLLKFCAFCGEECYALTEGGFAQIRRIDNQLLPATASLKERKSHTLSGSEGANGFFGWALAGGREKAGPLLIVEGCVGLMEAVAAAQLCEADVRGWGCLAAVSKDSRFTATDLDRLSGRRVVIVADINPDDAGVKAAGRWSGQLRSVECNVKVMLPPDGCKDLGDALKELETHREFISHIFNN